jgi:hypothetical protein
MNLMNHAPTLNSRIREDENVFLKRPFMPQALKRSEDEAQKLSRRIQLDLQFLHLLRMQADHMNVAKR